MIKSPAPRAAFPWRESGASAQRDPCARAGGGASECVCVCIPGINFLTNSIKAEVSPVCWSLWQAVLAFIHFKDMNSCHFLNNLIADICNCMVKFHHRLPFKINC